MQPELARTILDLLRASNRIPANATPSSQSKRQPGRSGRKISRIVLVKTSAWLLSESETPAFKVAGSGRPIRLGKLPEALRRSAAPPLSGSPVLAAQRRTASWLASTAGQSAVRRVAGGEGHLDPPL